MAEESHGGCRSNGQVSHSVVDSLVVDMENDVGAPELVAPAQDGVNNSQHLLDLDVVRSMAMWTSDREPVGSKESPKTFGTTGVCVDVKDTSLWGDETDTIPFHCESGPPCDVTASSLGKATAGKWCCKFGLKVVQPAEESTSSGDDLRGELQEARELLDVTKSRMRAVSPLREQLLEVSEFLRG